MVTPGHNPLNLCVRNNDYLDYRRLPGYIFLELNASMGIQPSSGTLTLAGDHPMARRLMQGDEDIVPITAEVNGYTWTGKVDDWVNEGTPQKPVLTCTLIDDKDQLRNIRALNSPESGLARQDKYGEKKGPVRVVVTDFIADNLARVELDSYVMLPPRNDNSPRVSVVTKMSSLTDLLTDVVNQHDLVCDIRMWWPGQPFPAGKFANLTSGNAGDRRQELRRTYLDQTFNPNTGPLTTPTKPALLVNIQPARNREWVRWSSDHAGVQHFRMSGKSPGAARQIVGGKSDDWVNETLDIGIDLAIQAVLSAVGSSLGPVGTAVGAFAGGIIGDFISGEVEDTVFAYQDRTDVERAARMGPFHRRENFTSSSAGAFTYDTSALVMRALQESQGGRAVEITVTNGIAMTLGNDWKDPTTGKTKHGYMPGDRNRFRDHLADREIVDIISGITITDSVDQRVRISPVVGKTKNVVNPYGEFVNKLGSLFSITEGINMTS